jgi:hypothetical protein
MIHSLIPRVPVLPPLVRIRLLHNLADLRVALDRLIHKRHIHEIRVEPVDKSFARRTDRRIVGRHVEEREIAFVQGSALDEVDSLRDV